jgi:hypothetical protein
MRSEISIRKFWKLDEDERRKEMMRREEKVKEVVTG